MITKTNTAAAPAGIAADALDGMGSSRAANDTDVAASRVDDGVIRAANDNMVGLGALAVAMAGGVPIPANDDVPAGTVPPLPGAYGNVPPSVWSQDDPHVVRLIAEARRVMLDPRGKASERRVAGALIECAQGDGMLPSQGGRPAILAFRRRYGLPSQGITAGTPGRAVFDSLAMRFRLEERCSTVDTRSGAVFRGECVNVTGAVRNYLDMCEAKGIPIPANGRCGFSTEGLATAIDMAVNRVRWNVPAKALVRGALAEGRVKLGDVFVPAERMTDLELRMRRAELKDVLDGFDVVGGKVPESPLHRGYVDWRYCASLTGRTEPTMQDDREFRRYAMAIVARRGVMLPGLALGVDNLATLRTYGLERIASENVGKPSCPVIVSNHKVVLDRLVREAKFDLADSAAEMFVPETFDAALDAALATFANPGSAANFKRAANRWRELQAAKVGAAALPDTLPDALDTLLGVRGVTQAAIAAKLGIKPAYVRELALGSMPVSRKGLEVIGCIEKEFDLVRGTLTSKVHPTTRRPKPQDATAEYRALTGKIRSLLPDEAAYWPVERLRLAVGQVSPLVSGGTSYGRLLMASHASTERMPQFAPNPRLIRQLAEFRAYKMAPVSYPLCRSRGARWKSALSATMGIKEQEMIYRFAVAPTDGGTAAGLGIPTDLQTLAWAAHAPFALALFGQRSARHASLDLGSGRASGRVYSVSERHLAAQLLSMTNPVTGYLTQRADLADDMVALDARLAPGHDDLLKMFQIEGGASILSDADVAFAKSDWVGFVGRSHRIYAQVVDHLDDVLEVKRNPFDPIRGLVDSPEPMALLLERIFASEKSWADVRTAPTLHQLDVRNAVLLRLAAITAFRPSNLTGLTFTADGRGKVRKVDGTWVIEVSYKEFKNFRNSELFGTSTSPIDYRKVLKDEAGLYDLLDLYFFEVRSKLGGGGIDGDAAFVGRLGVTVNNKSWYDIAHGFGRRHLAYNPVLKNGIPGVVGLNPYSFRHIRASDILKNGVSFDRPKEAALALQTSPAMIRRHYGFLLPNEAANDSEATFGRATRLAWKKNS